MKEQLPQTENPLFRNFAIPIETEGNILPRDAELFMIQDGIIVNAEGWFHPSGRLLAEVIYVPDGNGNKEFFGQKYKKVTLNPSSYDPIPYDEREQALAQIDPQFVQSKDNPFYARYKQFIPQQQLHSRFPAESALQQLLERNDEISEGLQKDLEGMKKMLGIDLNPRQLGVTGSLSLGNTQSIHDFDVVFSGEATANLVIARKIRDLVREYPSRRVIEGGKGWNIRFFNEYGTLMCCFFGYPDPKKAPLFDFTMDVIEDDAEMEGVVSDEAHSIYTPSVLGISDVKLKRIKGIESDERIGIEKLIVYHTASRGDCFEQDVINARGALVRVKTPEEEYLALCAIERNAVKNLTPNWSGYYE